MKIMAILGLSLIPNIATARAPKTGAGIYLKNSKNGSVNFEKKSNTPQKIPSGTPIIDESRNP
jgi:hypothetical protein